ncbi:MAG: sulfatase [Pirellulales bacterium]
MFKIFSCFLIAFSTLSSLERASAADRPNVIVMLVDDMGIMDTSVPMLLEEQGRPKRYPLNDYYRTPSMEQLAKRGICFSNFQAMSVCSPTRVCIMTGQNAARHRTTNWINPDNNNRGDNGPKDWNWKGLDLQSVTLARALQTNGYRTIHVGKGHFGPRDSEGSDPKNIGFDVSIGGASIGAPGSYYAEKKYGNGVGKSQHAVPDLEDYYDSGLFLTEALTRKANEHVTKAVQDGKPFFLYFAQYAVHSPFDSDPRFAENYAKTGKPKNAQAFATLIEGMDKSLGDVMAHVRQLGVEKDTLIIFLGDNGSDCPLGEAHNVGSSAPLRGKKGSHYEGGTRVPFIAAWCQPDDTNKLQRKLKIQPGTYQSQLAAVYDLFPTILDVTGVPVPTGHAIDGRSLKTLLAGKTDADYPEQFLMHYPHAPHRSDYFTVWRNGDWKLVYHYLPKEAQAGHVQLFNLKSDPFEQTDLAKSQPAEVARLTAEMIEQLKRQSALMPEDKSGQPIWPKLQN